MQIKPLNDKVAVKLTQEEEEEKTKGGIVLPETAQTEEKPQQGEVIAVGSKCFEDTEPEVSVGDTIVYDKFAGTEITVDDEDYVIVSIEDVLAVIE